ncbi:beta family protein [Desulforamulus aquiferis]|uniref:Beta family protein n=1 Tax=Desulforamulus aquiferis TaxID=1397668 RepID=A0AAW7ZC17_9FIRM|nr:beta family protein [Desulforamulus aquiferis]MDO7787232.1 beta family protein [Desulforamulus aquiferis]
MFDSKYYVPILKWKRGEQKALEFLSDQHKERLTPLIEIVPIPYDYANDRPQKAIDDHLKDIGNQLSTSWGKEKPIFLDLYWLDDSERLKDDRHPLEFIRSEASQKGINLIPVTGTTRSDDYNEAVKEAYIQDKLGVCIRLEDEDFLDIDSALEDLLEQLCVKPEQVDLVIDFKYTSPSDERKNILSMVSVINSIANINVWRNLILCCSAFPENMSGLPNDIITPIPRTEWITWKALVNTKKIRRMPVFGDYCIGSPGYVEMDPRIMNMTANVRYTVENDWLIAKGKSIKKHGGEQYYALCQGLTRHPQYCGHAFSWADQVIFDCAKRKCGPGNAETWRRVGTNHHLSFVVEQLSSFPVI